jgi:cell division septation protein DedD
MNKKTVSGLSIAATLILLLAVLYYLFTGTAPKTASTPVTPPGASAKTAQAVSEPVAPPPTQPLPKEPPAVPGMEPARPPQEAAPNPEAHVTVPPPLEPSQKYGILAGSYKQYRDAARMLDRLKKKGQPAFVQRDPRDLNRYQVWLGPFSSQEEARAAEKSLHDILKQPLKIEPIENPVPK